MKSCPKCLNLSADTAVACDQCGMVLDDSLITRAREPRTVTIVEPASNPRPSPPPLPGVRPSPPPSVNSPRRGETVYLPRASAAQPAAETVAMTPARVPERKIIAVLITYSWKPEGQVFPIREGRNLIGRGDECDIQVPADKTLSQTNSHITFRQSFVVGDMVSAGGTDLNGEPIEEQFRPLPNYAQIRTGSTNWTFVIIDPVLSPKPVS